MNTLYDNGCCLLGTKKSVIYQLNNKMLEEDDEIYMQILEDLKDLNEDTIISLNYDLGVNYSYSWWDKNDIVKED